MNRRSILLLAAVFTACHAPSDTAPDSGVHPWVDWTPLTDGYYWGAPGTFSGSNLSIGPVGVGELALMVGSTADTDEGVPYDRGGARLVRTPFAGGYLDDIAVAAFRPDESAGENFGWYALLPGDVTGDGTPDAAIPGCDTLSLFFSIDTIGGDLTHADADQVITGERGGWYGATTRDANHDGQQDMIAFPGIWYGPLSEPSSSPDVAITDEFSYLSRRALTSGDPDGDGRANLLMSDPDTVFLLDDELPADGTIDPSTGALTTWEITGAVEALLSGSDLDGDGLDDVVIAEMNYSTDPWQFTVYVLPDPAIAEVAEAPIRLSSLTGGSDHVALATGDFDGDGYADLAVGLGSPGMVFVYRGPFTTGAFDEHSADAWLAGADGLDCRDDCVVELCCVEVTEGGFGSALAAGDLDGDGRDDLAIGQPNIGLDGALWTGRVYIAWGGGLP